MYNPKQQAIFQKLEESFQTEDHWHFETSPFEKERFQYLVKLCESVPHSSILEIGCAEGHFTKLLCELSKNVTAIDISQTAVERAAKRAPQAQYVVGTLEEFPIPSQKYDLIVCSEMLYYLPDQKAGIRYIKRLGNYLVTSSFLMNNWGGYVSEFHLRSLHLLQRKILFSLKERKMSVVASWKLSA